MRHQLIAVLGVGLLALSTGVGGLSVGWMGNGATTFQSAMTQPAGVSSAPTVAMVGVGEPAGDASNHVQLAVT